MDKTDLLSRTYAYIGLLFSLIVFYFVLPYFYSPKKISAEYTEITFTLQKEAPLIKQDSAKASDIIASAAVENYENKIEIKEKEVLNTSQQVIKQSEKTPDALPKLPNKSKPITAKNKTAKATSSQSSPKKNLPRGNQNKRLNSTATITKNSASRQALPDLKQQQNQFANLIYSRLQASLTYPKLAIRRNLEGTAIISFSIKQGKIASYKISKSSGHKILDEAALKLAAKIASLSASHPLNFNLNVPLKYELH